MNRKTVRIIRYAVAAVLLLLIIIILAKCTPDTKKGSATINQAQNTGSGESTNVPEIPVEEQEQEQEAIEDNPIECDAYPEVNALVEKYFQAKASGDTEALWSTVNYVDPNEENTTTKMSDHIENYENIHCYTKKGPAENSYVVYAVYDIKFENIDTTAPSLTMLYVCTDEDGSLYIDNQTWNADEEAKISAMNQGDDVQALVAQVQADYDAAIASDEKLSNLASSIQQATEEQTDEDGGTVVYAKTTVNIRSNASETATKIGSLPQGESAMQLSADDSGWSHIEYNNATGYVKSEYLTTSKEEADQAAAQSAAQAAENSPSSGTAKVIETARMREGESTDSKLLETIYVDSQVTVVEKLSSGRTKITYNGKTGYVNSECLGN